MEKLEEVSEALKLQLDNHRGILILQGEAGTGKNVMVDMLANLANREVIQIACNENTVKEDLTYEFYYDPEKGTYKFALVDMDDEVIAKRKSSDKKKEAYKALGKMEASDTKLRNFFKVYGKRVPADATKDWMIGQVDEIIESDIDGFLTIVEDKDYETKLEIQDALDCRALVKKGSEYELPGGESLGNLEEVISKLKNPKFSEILVTIRSRISTAKG